MKLLNILKKTILEENNPKGVLLEISEKMKRQLIAKFSGTTNDTIDIISSNIDYFERIKSGLDPQQRDINRFSYEDLKNVITSKRTAKGVDEIFDDFKKREQKLDNVSLRKNIRKFLDIQSELPKQKQDISNYKFLELEKLMDDVYGKLLYKKLLDKYLKENPNLTVPQITYYIENYLGNFNEFPLTGKISTQMSFSEFEHLVDGVLAKQTGKQEKVKDISDIQMKYDQNNLKVFAPKTKDQCIKLRNGRTWCTSREGSSNLYYNYRLDNERTLYYVIDEDKDFSDLNFAVVILVDPYGRMALADGSNSGRYSGHQNIPWDEIVKKIPKLDGLENLFEPNPLTDEEKMLISKVKRINVKDNPMESFNTEEEVELWLEILSPRLEDIQYINLTPNLKKKYIALGMDLSSKMLTNSEPDVQKYYINKKLESVKNKSLSQLDSSDIALLNLPTNKKIKDSLRSRYMKEVVSDRTFGKRVEMEYPSGVGSKFIGLYGFEIFFAELPEDLNDFLFSNKSDDFVPIDLPPSISRFKNLSNLLLMNCVKSLPKEIGELQNLSFLSLPNNPELKKLPDEVLQLPNLVFINLLETPTQLPKNFNKYFSEADTHKGVGFYIKQL